MAPAGVATGPAVPDVTYSAAGVRPAPADIRFMQGMLGHHAQALEMTGLVAGRGARREVALLARRIELSQRSEMERIRGWLGAVGTSGIALVGEEHAAHAAGSAGASVPGMLTPAELDALAAAAGPDFDRLFLTGMIRHHEGALEMVARLFGSADGGQDPEIYDFASHVDSSQRAEIARMRRLRDGL